MSVEQEYEVLVRQDHASTVGAPDVESLVRAGERRLRRRRATVVAGAAALAAAAVAIPALAITHGDGARPAPSRDADRPPVAGTTKGPHNSPPPDPATVRGCGWFSCAEGTKADTKPVLGEVMKVDTTARGTDEVVWASERNLYDPATDQNVVGPVLMTGFTDGDQRVDGVFALQPGHEFAPSCQMSFWGGLSSSDGGWSMIGYVEGEADEVAYQGGTGDGSTISSTTVLKGYTVFVAHGPGGVDGFPTSFQAQTDDGVVTGPVGGCSSMG